VIEPPSISLASLDAERWRKIERVLDAALDVDPEEVPALLDRACAADLELRRQVQQLIDADAGAGAFLSVPAAALAPHLAEESIVLTGADDFGRASGDATPAPTAEPPREIGRYVVRGELGRGGMGIVYLGRDEKLGRSVAIKMLPERFARDAERVERFRREARLLASLHHANIAAIHGLEQSATGQQFLILERVEGMTLSERLRRDPMSMKEALDVCGQIADALATAHSYGIVHRDLKPGNVMVTAAGLVKVLDFGLAKHVAPRDTSPRVAEPAREGGSAGEPPPAGGVETRRESPREPAPPAVSGAGARLGTPGYMSREQILGLEQDARTDVFAFGCVLFECLTGSRAFSGRTPFATVSATLSSPVDLARLPADTPHTIRSLLARALEKDAARRLSGLDEFASLCAAHARETAPVLRRGLRPSRSGRLRAPGTAFIGREREIETCTRLLERARLVTLTGAGGCGKTRLALEVARTLSPREPAGVWFADLAPVSDPLAVPAVVAEAAGVRAASSEELGEALARDMAGRPGLLVLDNCERLIGPCAALAAELLGRCESLRILATSREWLGAPGEQTLRVAPLAIPAPDAEQRPGELEGVESVRLFLAGARAARHDFSLDPSSLALVAGICRRLDGIPLALELAAAMLRELSLAQIARVLEDRVAAAAGGADEPSDALASAIRWSYEQLSPSEQSLFRALAVFAGGCSLESAVAVCGEGRDEFGVLDLMTRLVDHSLVAIERADRVEPRYRLLEPIRDFATLRSEAERQAEALAGRHLDHFLTLAERAAPELMGGPDQSLWLARIEADHQNLLAAMRTCERVRDGGEKALRLGGAIWWLWYVRGHFALGRDALARALALPGAAAPSLARALVLYASGGLAIVQADYAAARVLNTEALGLYRSLGDRIGVARSLTHLGIAAIDEGRYDEARGFYTEAITIFRELNDVRRLARTLNNLGVVAMRQDDFPGALSCYEESLRLARRTEDRDGMSLTLVNLGLVATRLGRLEEARRHVSEVLAMIAEVRGQRVGTAALETAGELLFTLGQEVEAARMLGAADALRRRIGYPQDLWWRKSQANLSDRLLERMGAENCGLHWRQGAELPFGTAVAEARRAVEAEKP
jgi:predicted ATPase/serine/threonine protein kinase